MTTSGHLGPYSRDLPSPMKTAFVFSGGASLGALQVGQLRALTNHGIVPDLVVGTSVGSLNAAWFAAEPDSMGIEQLESLWRGISGRDIFPLRPDYVVAGLVGHRDHFVSDVRLRLMLAAILPVRLVEDTDIALHVIATDTEEARAIVISRGNLLEAVMASCAIPRIFPPVTIAGRRLVDGGVVALTPIAEAVDLGASRLFVLSAVDGGSLLGRLATIGRSLGFLPPASLTPDNVRAEIVTLPIPSVGLVNPFSFSRTASLIETSYDLTSRFLAEYLDAADEKLSGHVSWHPTKVA